MFLIWFALIEFIRNLIFLLCWCSLNRWIIWTKFFSNIDIIRIHDISLLFDEFAQLTSLWVTYKTGFLVFDGVLAHILFVVEALSAAKTVVVVGVEILIRICHILFH